MKEHQYRLGFRTFNFGESYIDVSSTYVDPLADYTDGAVHPVDTGAYAIGKKMAAFLATLESENILNRPVSNADPLEMLANPWLIGDSSGYASGWLSATSSVTAAPSKSNRTDIPGEWQVLGVSACSADRGYHQIYRVLNPATSAIGKRVQGYAELQISAAPTLPDGPFITVEVRNSTSTIIQQWSSMYRSTTSIPILSIAAGDTFQLMTGPLVVSEDAATVRLRVHSRYMNGGSGSWKVGSAGIRLID